MNLLFFCLSASSALRLFVLASLEGMKAMKKGIPAFMIFIVFTTFMCAF